MRAIMMLSTALVSQAAPAEVVHFDCDTPGSHSAEWARDVTKPNLSVAGAVRLVEERPFRNAIPAANVFLAKEPGKALIALRFIAYPDKKNSISVTLFNAQEPGKTYLLADIDKTKDPIPFSMTLRSTKLNVVVGGDTYAMDIEPQLVKQISLSCFSAQFKFASVSTEESD